jgi:pyrimidine operon attenuation protein/uracil phosphoribosyltransferase
VENHGNLDDTVLLGIQPRGVFLSRRIKALLEEFLHKKVDYGEIDITFHRDDIRRRDSIPTPSKTTIDVSLEGKKVVLIDDVLYTGRTIRAGLDALLSYGRPAEVELLVLIDRRFSRELPIQPDHVGKWVDAIDEQRVAVEWKEVEGTDKVILLA